MCYNTCTLIFQDAGPMAHPVRPHSYIKVRIYKSFPLIRLLLRPNFFQLCPQVCIYLSLTPSQMDNFYTGKFLCIKNL